MKHILLLLCLPFIFYACSSSLPPEIPAEYLVDVTMAETKYLEDVELLIISKPDEKIEVQKKIRQSKKIIEAAKHKRNQLELNLTSAESLIKQLELNKKVELVKDQAKKIKELKQKITLETMLLKFLTAQDIYQQAEVELINSELATFIARYRLIQAKIGRQNQDRILGSSPPDTKAGNRIDIALYESYLVKKNIKLAGAKEKKGKTAQLLAQAKKQYQDFLSQQDQNTKPLDKTSPTSPPETKQKETAAENIPSIKNSSLPPTKKDGREIKTESLKPDLKADQ